MRLSFRFGKLKGFGISNFNLWFVEFLRNHLFPWFIPEVHDIATAQRMLRNPPGRKPEDERVKVLVSGTSNLFFDYELVKSRAQSNLLRFLERMLDMMAITCKDGKKPTMQRIEKIIDNLPHDKKSPLLYSDNITPCEKPHHWLPSSTEVLNWLETQDPRTIPHMKKTMGGSEEPSQATETDS